MPAPAKPSKTLADVLVIGVSPVLIMLLVGSLTFFLIEVFFRGEAIGSVRWVMFWFVLAVVLITRIGIEQGKSQAAIYGLFLAGAVWVYLARVHPAYILGALLLALVWWCAHKLTWDCTLIDEDEDASGGGLIETAVNRKGFSLFSKKVVVSGESQHLGVRRHVAASERDDMSARSKARPSPRTPKETPHSPGLWVVWFSVAALPLFGIGQMLLPRTDADARHAGFVWLFVYVSAALGLLLTTSFLGLRRYLRQRYLTMPGAMAFGWIRFGGGLAALVLMGALLLPRPGATAAWQTLAYHIDYKLHQASDYAAKFGPHGSGEGRVGNEQDNTAQQQNNPDSNGVKKTPGESPKNDGDKTDKTQDHSSPATHSNPAMQIYQWLRLLFILAVACLLAWWLYRNREVLAAMAKSLWAAIRQFFADLFHWGSSTSASEPAVAQAVKRKRHPFATFQNPFVTGQDSTWTPEQLVLYSYEALQAWAEEQGVEPRPELTAREFCLDLGGRFPEITEDLRRLSSLYGHAAYGVAVPPGRDLEPVKQIWRFLRSA